MAKKPVHKDTPKKRKSAATKPAPSEGAPPLGSCSILVQASVWISSEIVNFNEVVIEWECLGLVAEPDAITEISGNSHLLDPDHPPYTDEAGLHVRFKPALNGGTYGFQFKCTYNEAAEARTATEEDDEKEAQAKEEKAA